MLTKRARGNGCDGRMSERVRLKYCPVGAVSEIGASAHYLQFDRWGVLLDAGLDPHHALQDGVPAYDLLYDRPVNAILITHAHLDHIGSLPVALQRFPRARVYMTPATAELTEVMLHHYLHVQRKQAMERWQPYRPLYSEEYLDMIRYLFQSFDYEAPFWLHGYEESGLRFTFYDAGHILGSAGVLIEWRGRRLFYTGNVRLSAQFILKGARLPDSVDVLITEATYGADAEAETIRRSAEVKRFARHLSERLRMGGVVLLPVFALGRTQEMLMLLHRLRQKNQIPAVPIYVAGFGLAINRLYDRMLHKIYPEYHRGQLRTITFGRWSRGRHLRGPAILISTSGMLLPGSASFDFARQLAEDARNAIFFVGYADPETPGGLLREKKFEALKELFQVDRLECGVEVFRFSAHAHRRELLKLIKRLQPSQIILTHGEKPALQWMAEHIPDVLPDGQVLIPESGTWYDL
ncbi:MAG: MBL fold metallo-hydrolase [Calditrichaeota bacterium]|nr:MBL fold metallo-hydrolase [Calditrichota bacterium]